MKKYYLSGLFLSATLLLGACSEEEEVTPIASTIEEYEKVLPASDFEKGENNKYMSSVNTDIAYFAEENEEGEITSVFASAVTSNFDVQKAQIETSFKLLVESVDSTLSETQIDKLFDDLNITWNSDMLDTSKVKIFKDVTYTFYGDNENGAIVLKAEKR